MLCEVFYDVADGNELEALLAPHRLHMYLVRESHLLPSAHILPDRHFRDWLFTVREPSELEAVGIPVARSVEG